MAVINTNPMTVKGTHGLSIINKTKVAATPYWGRFIAPRVQELNFTYNFFITNGEDDWSQGNELQFEGFEIEKRSVNEAIYNAETDGDLFLYFDNLIIAKMLEVDPTLDPTKLVSEFEPVV